jgi:hypothetical protein
MREAKKIEQQLFVSFYLLDFLVAQLPNWPRQLLFSAVSIFWRPEPGSESGAPVLIQNVNVTIHQETLHKSFAASLPLS